MDAASKLHEIVCDPQFNQQALVTYLDYFREAAGEDQSSFIMLMNKRNESKYSALHLAIFCRNIEAVKMLVDAGADPNLKCHGTPPIHLCLSMSVLPCGSIFGDEAFFYLSNSNRIVISAQDDQGANIIHIASELNKYQILEYLLPKIQQDNEIIIDLESKDRTGQTALHRAVSKDSLESVAVLLQYGASISTQTLCGQSALHFAVIFCALRVWNLFISSDRSDIVQAFQTTDAFGRTACETAILNGWKQGESGSLFPQFTKTVSNMTSIISDHACLQHHTCPPSQLQSSNAPPENVHRLNVLINEDYGALHASDIRPNLRFELNAQAATMSDLLRVHEWSYIQKLQQSCLSLSTDPESEDDGIGNLDSDTTISHMSFEAAKRAAGSVCAAVDRVLSKEVKNAFCPVRPPGHHSGPRGVVKSPHGGSDSHGFCLLNNIAIGAAYALNVHRNSVKRVAMVDFDVHHGQGTEETVRWLHPGTDEVFIENDLTFGTLKSSRYKPWFDSNDAENVLFVSVHGYGPRQKGLEQFMPQAMFYPGTGATTFPEVVSAPLVVEANVDAVNNEGQGLDIVASDDNEEEEEEGDKDYESEGEDDEDEDNDNEIDKEDESSSDEEEDSDNIELGDDAWEQDPRDHAPTGTGTGASASSPKDSKKKKAIDKDKSLILDIGVRLPENGESSGTAYRHMWRNYFRDDIFPRLLKFKPDIILISAGFDAHKKDLINSGYISLLEEDFEWVTTHLTRIANSCCEGRVVSVLEGGYQLGGEYSSAFAKSVKAHVGALVSAASSTCPYLQEDAQKEKDIEIELICEAETKRLHRIHARNIAASSHNNKIIIEQKESQLDHVNVDEIAQQSGNEGRHKRKRPQVDYLALDEKLREQKSLEDTTTV